MRERVQSCQGEHHPSRYFPCVAHDEVVPEGEKARDVLHAALISFLPEAVRSRSSRITTTSIPAKSTPLNATVNAVQSMPVLTTGSVLNSATSRSYILVSSCSSFIPV